MNTSNTIVSLLHECLELKQLLLSEARKPSHWEEDPELAPEVVAKLKASIKKTELTLRAYEILESEGMYVPRRALV